MDIALDNKMEGGRTLQIHKIRHPERILGRNRRVRAPCCHFLRPNSESWKKNNPNCAAVLMICWVYWAHIAPAAAAESWIIFDGRFKQQTQVGTSQSYHECISNDIAGRQAGTASLARID